MKKIVFACFFALLIFLSTFLLACSVDENNGVIVIRDPSDTDDFKMNSMTTINVGLSWNQDWYYGGIDAGNNPAYDLFKSAMNINVVNKFALPWEGYEAQITSGIITGNIPDAFFADQKMLDELIRNDAIVDMKPYYDLWATNELKETLEYNNKANFSYVSRDGKIYGIPSVSDDCNRPIVWTRKDWLATLNGRPLPNGATKYDIQNDKRFHETGPQTLNEFWDLATAFAKENPDNNENVQTYGLSLSKNLDDLSLPIFNAYGAYPDIIEKQPDGTFKNLGLDEKMKEPLQKLQDMVRDGVINSDYYNWDSQAALMKAGSNLVGIALAVPYSPLWPLGDVLSSGGDWIASKMVTKDGSEFIPGRKLNATGYYVVKKGYKNPEVVIKMLNNMATSNHENAWYQGSFNIQSDSKNNNFINWLPIRIDKSEINFTRSTIFNAVIDNYKLTGQWDESTIPPNEINTWNKVKSYVLTKDSAGWGMYKTFIEGVPVAKSYGNGLTGKYTDWVYPPTATIKSRSSALETMTTTTRTRIISGTYSIDKFDEYVADWYSGGGTKILKEMSDYVKKLNLYGE